MKKKKSGNHADIRSGFSRQCCFFSVIWKGDQIDASAEGEDRIIRADLE
jgi:hypothetical protein